MRRGPLTSSRRTVAVAAIVLALLAAGCSSDPGAAPPVTSATTAPAPPATSAPADPAAPTTTAATGTTVPDTANEAVHGSQLSQLAAFADVPWADDMKVEQDRFSAMGKPPSKYGDTTIPDFEGRYTNVRDGERRTLHLPCEGCPKRVVWLSGNSAAFGYAQRDDYTIASQIARLGAEAGLDITVRNLGVPGTAFYDERPWLEAHLEIDEERPDLIVFYDGFNDVLLSYMYAIVRDGDLLDPVSYEGEFMAEYQAITPPPDLDPELVPTVAAHVADEYRSSQREIAELLEDEGIDTAYFFQPDSFISELQSEGLTQSLNPIMAALPTKSSLAKLLTQTARQLEGDSHNLRPLFADYEHPVFADPAHMNEEGAALVAAAIYDVIGPGLER